MVLDELFCDLVFFCDFSGVWIEVDVVIVVSNGLEIHLIYSGEEFSIDVWELEDCWFICVQGWVEKFGSCDEENFNIDFDDSGDDGFNDILLEGESIESGGGLFGCSLLFVGFLFWVLGLVGFLLLCCRSYVQGNCVLVGVWRF